MDVTATFVCSFFRGHLIGQHCQNSLPEVQLCRFTTKFPSSLESQLNLQFCLPSAEPSGKNSILNFSPHTCAWPSCALFRNKCKGGPKARSESRSILKTQYKRDYKRNRRPFIRTLPLWETICSETQRLILLHSNTAPFKSFIVWNTSLPWIKPIVPIAFVIYWWGWLVCCPVSPVVTVTERELGRWKWCRYPSSTWSPLIKFKASKISEILNYIVI